MNPWKPYPIIRLVIPFIAGIYTATNTGWSLNAGWIILLAICTQVLIYFILPRYSRTYRLRWITGIPVHLFFFFFGFGLTQLFDQRNHDTYFGYEPEGIFLVSVKTPPAETEKYCKAILQCHARIENGRMIPACGLVLAYLQKGPPWPGLLYGDLLLVKTRFDRVFDNSNPHGFNYYRFLDKSGISYQAWVGRTTWHRLPLPNAGMIRRAAYALRDHLLSILRENDLKGQEYAVASALLLGYVNDIDENVRRDYAATGAMHILSVSGMHVGIIYLFLEFVLSFLSFYRFGKWIKAIMILGVIWLYAMVTGLSPSVLRAATMLTLPIIATSINRTSEIGNSIGASCFILLLMNPFHLNDTGFQLSYLAVSGIVVLYRPIYDLLTVYNWLGDKAWSLIAVSLAAQISTFPLSLYIFHQFPNYFMLTNLVVVPLSSLIIYTGIFVLAVSPVPSVALIAGKALSFLIFAMNLIIHRIESIPFSTTVGVYLSNLQLGVVYLVTGSLMLFVFRRSMLYLNITLFLLVIMTASSIADKWSQREKKRIIVFNTRNLSLTEFATQNKAVFMADRIEPDGTVWSEQARRILSSEVHANNIKHFRHYWTGNDAWKGQIAPSFIDLERKGNVFWFSGLTMVIVNRWIPPGAKATFPVDILVITQNPAISIELLVEAFHPRQVVIDATNTFRNARKWMDQLKKNDIKYHYSAQDGAFIKEF